MRSSSPCSTESAASISAAQARSPTLPLASAEKLAHDRLVFVFTSLVGHGCVLTTKDGDKFSGVLSGVKLDSPDCKYLLKMVKKLPSSFNTKLFEFSPYSDNYDGQGSDYSMSFNAVDVVDFYAPGVDPESHILPSKISQKGFKTDADIAQGHAIKKRNLQRWQSDIGTGVELSLDDKDGIGWDQFEANERLYGAKTDYDENLYTTPIDRNHPMYKKRAADADRIAREIENSSALTSHVVEERGLVSSDQVDDEENRYSGVLRGASTSNLTISKVFSPPARRSQQSINLSSEANTNAVPMVNTSIPMDEKQVSSSLNEETQQTAGAKVNPSSINVQVQPSSGVSKPLNVVRNDNSSSKTNYTPNVPSNEASIATGSTGASVSVNRKAGEPTGQATNTKSSKYNSGSIAEARSSTSTSTVGAYGSTTITSTTVEHDVLDSFKQFSATEKLRVQQHQWNLARHDKQVKLNDLKKFASDFKLHTPVPTDLVPILAKDKAKQREIVQKALRQIEESKSDASAKAKAKGIPPSPAESVPSGSNEPARSNKSSKGSGNNGVGNASHGSPSVQAERLVHHPRNRGGQNPYSGGTNRGERFVPGNQFMQSVHNRAAMGQRGVDNRVPHRLPPNTTFMPHTMPLLDARGPVGMPGPMISPNNVPRFNVQATEFKPGSAPYSSSQTSSIQSPGTSKSGDSPPRISSTPFFADGPVVNRSGRANLRELFDTLKRLKNEISGENRPEFQAVGGIPPSYRTPPTWDIPTEKSSRSYVEYFSATPITRPYTLSPIQPAASSVALGAVSGTGMGIGGVTSASVAAQHRHQHSQSYLAGMAPMGQIGTPMSGIPAHQAGRYGSVPGYGSAPIAGAGAMGTFDDQRIGYTGQSMGVIHPSSRAVSQQMMAYGAIAPGIPFMPYAPVSGMMPGMTEVNMAAYPAGGIPFGGSGIPMGGHIMSSQNSNGSGGVGGYMPMINPHLPIYTPGPLYTGAGGGNFGESVSRSESMIHQVSQQDHHQASVPGPSPMPVGSGGPGPPPPPHVHANGTPHMIPSPASIIYFAPSHPGAGQIPPPMYMTGSGSGIGTPMRGMSYANGIGSSSHSGSSSAGGNSSGGSLSTPYMNHMGGGNFLGHRSASTSGVPGGGGGGIVMSGGSNSSNGSGTIRPTVHGNISSTNLSTTVATAGAGPVSGQGSVNNIGTAFTSGGQSGNYGVSSTRTSSSTGGAGVKPSGTGAGAGTMAISKGNGGGLDEANGANSATVNASNEGSSGGGSANMALRRTG